MPNCGQGCNHIVGFPSIDTDPGNVGSLQDLLDTGNLGMQILGSRIPVGLVGLVQFMTEGGCGGVHGNHKIVGSIFANQHEQGAEKSIERRNIVPL
jgi:hypothetical protein